MNSKKDSVSTLLITLFLFGLPISSQADLCADIKERYWKCARSSMTGEKCDESDNVSIPPECLTAGSKSPANSDSPSSAPSFFSSKKEPKTFIPKPDSAPKKPVKIINIKPSDGKTYLETEEEVNQFTSKIKDDLLNAIRDGKKVRLKFQ